MNEFIKHDGKIIVNVDHAEAYIPESMFGSEESGASIAYEYGEGYKIIGIFNMKVTNDPNDDLSKAPLRTFNYPNMIETYPSGTEKRKIVLTSDGEEDSYRVFKYVQGDIMMSAAMPKAAGNCTKFLNAINSGKLPTTLNYTDILLAWHKNFETNGLTPAVPSLYLQAMLAEKCRYRKDPSIPFRKIYGKNMNNNDYANTNMRGLASYSSVFNALAFEDMGRMLGTSVNMTRRQLPQAISPIEKTLYM